jgi:hydroxyacylglutathione hydrolase
MTHGQPSRPANVENIVAINQGRQPLAASLPIVPALTPAAADTLARSGALFLDARDSRDFGAAHIPGAYNVQLSSSQFEQRVGWVLPGDAPLILILGRDEDLPKALHKLAFIGLENRVAGFAAGGMDAWRAAGYPAASLPQTRPADLQAQLEQDGLIVLDVREGDEYDAGHIAGARQISYKTLDARLDELNLDPDAPLAIVCASGMRSSTAASLLLRRGYTNVSNVAGGMDAWRRAALPEERPPVFSPSKIRAGS